MGTVRNIGLVALGLVLVSKAVLACQVPVFRYALDRWKGESYQLKGAAGFEAAFANIKVDTKKVEVSELYAPYDKEKPIWSGKLDEKSFSKLASSPKRKEIAKRILAGDAAVWVMVESGDEKVDKDLYDRLNDRLTFFQSVAELPEIDPADPTSQLGPGPELKLQFSIMKIKHDDPEEALLLKMLAGPKAKELPKGKPFVSPVFGQGRVLGAWTGEKMDAEGIDEACFYMSGACSCEVKAQNPGWDLLISVDWKKELLVADKKRLEAQKKSEKK